MATTATEIKCLFSDFQRTRIGFHMDKSMLGEKTSKPSNSSEYAKGTFVRKTFSTKQNISVRSQGGFSSNLTLPSPEKRCIARNPATMSSLPAADYISCKKNLLTRKEGG
ncbi:hypothetical protein JTE90_011719 [Oedothorax gibbosus]|uniref:Uncharacterized protein n=1 Tax=Oedothorax gibbosus TaxID=931172 RepID=A0AAV6TQ64_9ARAC|nr:hypothetical protein JTE90_011719 [Oedothorax gibbosus]